MIVVIIILLFAWSSTTYIWSTKRSMLRWTIHILSVTSLVRKYPGTTNCTGNIHWSCVFQFHKYGHTVTCLQLVYLHYICISHYVVCGMWLNMNYYIDNCWSIISRWICTMEDFLFYWFISTFMYCVLLKRMQLTCTAWVEPHQNWNNFWEKTYRCAAKNTSLCCCMTCFFDKYWSPFVRCFLCNKPKIKFFVQF